MAVESLSERYERAQQVLEPMGQGHVLGFYNELDQAGRERLLGQIEQVDWTEVGRLVDTHVARKPELKIPDQIEPAPWYAFEPTAEQAELYERARQAGEQLLREGKVAAFTVAGGQGTRLGWDGPKGTFPATPIRRMPLFGVFAEYLLKAQRKYDCVVPWYVMTSLPNDAQTRAFFEEHDYFGLKREDVMFFAQGMMPAFDMRTHKVLMESRDSIALSPNGHGGSLKALHTSGALADMKRRGVEQISYIQVDNPNVHVVDPRFLGLHVLDGAQMSSKMIPKAYPKEKLGNFCVVDGKLTVIEYSDLPEELAEQRTADGQLRFRAGSIAIHAMRRDFVEGLTGGESFSLPYHRAEKKVGHVDVQSGERVEPEGPNAVKLETFVFDALPLCEKSIVVETDRVEEFAPIKNAEGVDSPLTSRNLQIERAARWLAAHGVAVPRGEDDQQSVRATIEIKPTTAIEAGDLKGVDVPTIEVDREVLL